MCGICNSTDGLVWGCWRMIDHDGLWSGSEEFCDLKVENVLCNYANRPAWGCWDWMTMKGYGRKRRSFGEINQMVIFRENVYKRDFLPISTEMYFWEKVLNETSYKNRFMGKVLKPSFLFSIKIWRFQNKVLLNKSISFSFQQGYRVFKANEVLFKQ